jgi:TonB family protein
MMDWGEILLRVTVLWAAGEIAALLAARRDVRLGHLIRICVVAGMLAVPLLSLWLPAQYVTVPGWRTAAPVDGSALEISYEPVLAQSATLPPARPGVSWPVIVYLAVAAVLLARMAAGGFRLRNLVLHSRPEEPAAAQELAQTLGLKPGRIAVRSSARVTIPFTAGVRRPVVLLPENWREWPEDKLRSVLAHELAHVARKDWMTARLAAVNRALYWFHPAAWWLERRLAAEAEECADQMALAVLGDRRSYVETILDFARAVQARRLHGLEATAMARSSRTGKRLEKILAATRFSAKPVRRAALVLLVLAALPAVLAAALLMPVPQPPEAPPAPPAPPPTVLMPSQKPLGDQEAAQLEASLQNEPNDDGSRFRLLNHYVAKGETSRAREHAMFLIEQRPESPYAVQATMLWAGVARRGEAAEDIRQLAQIWKRQVAGRPESARLLANAANVLTRAGELFDAESLLERARRLEPADPFYTAGLASLYANAILGAWQGSPEFVQKARMELASTPDALLLAHVAEILLAYTGPRRSASDPKSLAAQEAEARVKEAEKYLRRALLLDPENDAAKKVMAIYESRMKQEPSPQGAAPKRIRVAPRIQQAMLVFRQHPVYPEEARKARIEGTVRFRVVIGADGTVKTATLLSGHPALVQAAQAALMQYRYRPTLLNGEPAEVDTEVEVPFVLPGENPPQAQVRPLKELLAEGGTHPVPIRKVEPEFSREARAARHEGSVDLEILIDEQGVVREARVLREAGLGLDQKAIEAVLQWKFKPAEKDGSPVPVWARVEMNFRLLDPPAK